MALMTEEELRIYIKISRRMMYKLRQQGMPYFMVGSNIRYDLSQVLTWLSGQNKQKKQRQ